MPRVQNTWSLEVIKSKAQIFYEFKLTFQEVDILEYQ